MTGRTVEHARLPQGPADDGAIITGIGRDRASFASYGCSS